MTKEEWETYYFYYNSIDWITCFFIGMIKFKTLSFCSWKLTFIPTSLSIFLHYSVWTHFNIALNLLFFFSEHFEEFQASVQLALADVDGCGLLFCILPTICHFQGNSCCVVSHRFQLPLSDIQLLTNVMIIQFTILALVWYSFPSWPIMD